MSLLARLLRFSLRVSSGVSSGNSLDATRPRNPLGRSLACPTTSPTKPTPRYPFGLGDTAQLGISVGPTAAALPLWRIRPFIRLRYEQHRRSPQSSEPLRREASVLFLRASLRISSGASLRVSLLEEHILRVDGRAVCQARINSDAVPSASRRGAVVSLCSRHSSRSETLWLPRGDVERSACCFAENSGGRGLPEIHNLEASGPMVTHQARA